MSSTAGIITRTKDRPLLLRRAMEGVLNQTYDDWIHVVINDGGAPEPVDRLVEEFESRYQGRILTIHNPSSLGMEGASNKAIDGSQSRYLVIHDDDDTWHPDFLSLTCGYMAAPAKPGSTAGVVSGFVKIVERIEDDRIVEIEREDITNRRMEITLWQLCAKNLFPTMSFLYERSAYDKIGPYRADMKLLGDWEFNLRFLSEFDIGMIDERLAFYHHRASTGGTYANSMIGGMDAQAACTRALRNEMLRRDLQAGRLGLGVLMNLAPSLQIAEQATVETNAIVISFNEAKAKIAARLRRLRLLGK